MNYNKVMIAGRLTRDIELRYLPNNTACADMGLAVNEKYKDKNTGEYVEKVNFIDCTAFGKSAESVAKFFSKGRPIFIEGRLKYEQWESDGQKRSKIKVVVDQWNFCDSKVGGESQGQQRQPNQGGGGGGYGGPDHQPIEDSDIPFGPDPIGAI